MRSSRIQGIALALAVAVSGVAGAADSESLVPDAKTMTRLLAGEWVLESASSDENGAAAGILIFVRAPVESIWRIITSCHYAQVFVAGMEYCEVVQDSGSYAVTRQVVDKGWTTPRMDYVFETRREPWKHMEFSLLGGNLKTLRGTWDFRALPGGTLVRHYLVLKPKVPAPRWLVRRNLRRDLPAMLQCIRGLADGSGTAEQQAGDLDQCPGELP